MDYLVGFIVIVIVVGLILLFGINTSIAKKGEALLHAGNIQVKWNSLQAARFSRNINSLRHAVITADKLVDHSLRNIHTPGETLAERVKNARNALGDTYEKFWDAHRTRNRMVHEIDSEVRAHEAEQALNKYEEVLKQLGVIN